MLLLLLLAIAPSLAFDGLQARSRSQHYWRPIHRLYNLILAYIIAVSCSFSTHCYSISFSRVQFYCTYISQSAATTHSARNINQAMCLCYNFFEHFLYQYRYSYVYWRVAVWVRARALLWKSRMLLCFGFFFTIFILFFCLPFWWNFSR